MTNPNKSNEQAMRKKKILFVPITPAGTPVMYSSSGKLLAAGTREQAIKNLLKDAAHMPYKTWENFEKRGYTIEEFEEQP